MGVNGGTGLLLNIKRKEPGLRVLEIVYKGVELLPREPIQNTPTRLSLSKFSPETPARVGR